MFEVLIAGANQNLLSTFKFIDLAIFASFSTSLQLLCFIVFVQNFELLNVKMEENENMKM